MLILTWYESKDKADTAPQKLHRSSKMSWPQMYCPKCHKHLDWKKSFLKKGTSAAINIHKCPDCGYEFGVWKARVF